MAKLALTPTAAGYSYVTTMNANNDLIEAALENTLSRDGTSPNTMSAPLDMNSQLINNIATPVNDQSAATKKYVDDIVTGFTSSATFSAALPYDVTGSWDFEAVASFEAGLRVYDAVDGSDYLEITHDGTDANVASVNTTDINFLDGVQIKVWDATDTEYSEWYTLSAAGATIYNTSQTVGHDFRLNDVVKFQIQNAEVFSQLPIKMKEAAAAPADDLTYGCIWVKDNAPNDLFFTDDTGQDVQITDNGALASQSLSLVAVKSADESITSDSTLTSDSDLVVTLPTVDKHYRLEAWLYFTVADATPDLKFAWAASNALQLGRMGFTMLDAAGTLNGDNVAMTATTSVALAAGAPNSIGIHMTGMFQSNAATAGTLALQWAQNTSDANALVMKEGSWIKVEQLD